MRSSQSSRGLERIRTDWTRLGAEDPMWAVLVSPETRHGRWNATSFFATGRREVDESLAAAAALGARPGTAMALDLGCGVGRLTAALAEHVDEVVGVDISPTMIERARQLNDNTRCRFQLSDGSDLSMFKNASVDIAYSSLVLQHVPAPHNAFLLSELMRVLRPGGLLVLQVASEPDRSLKGVLFRYAPRTLLRAAQKYVLRYPAPMEMHPLTHGDVAQVAAEHAVEILTSENDPMYGGNWIYTKYYLVKRS